jgi:hypothetical protein
MKRPKPMKMSGKRIRIDTAHGPWADIDANGVGWPYLDADQCEKLGKWLLQAAKYLRTLHASKERKA